MSSLKASTRATTSTSTPDDILLITIDDENPVLTEELQNANTNSDNNPDDIENHSSELLTVEPAIGSTEVTASSPVVPDESSRSSEDSTLELLHDFGKVFTDYTKDVEKDIPSELVIDPAERPLTSPPVKEKISAPIYQTQVPTNREPTPISKEHTDEICQNLPGTENENELKNIVKKETSDTSVMKSEQGLDVKLEPANVQVATTDWVPKSETDNMTLKHEGVKDEHPENPTVHIYGPPTNSDDTIKHESEDEYVDRDLDFTVIDAGLIKSLIACNKPRPKPKPTPKKHKKSTKTKKSSKKSVKCTPLDRAINATSKQLFAQLRSIKLEVKRENVERLSSPLRDNSTNVSHEKPSALSSLDNLDIPDLIYHPETIESPVLSKATTESGEHELNSTTTRNDISEERSGTDTFEPFPSFNVSTDHEADKASTDNVTPSERSSTDMSETDSDHDPNWELKSTGGVSQNTERKIKT